ncbi:MAG: YiiX/YebB-like N1pC/P60 family cysteine hydrolase [Bacteroidota bacterium]
MNKKLLFFLLLLLSFSCQSTKKDQPNNTTSAVTSFDYSKFKLKSGDILFQDSDCGPFCESIEKVTFGIQGSKFSHVGLVIPKNGKLIVLEAISAGVVETPLDSFFIRSFDADNNSKVVVGRMKQEHEQLISQAIKFAKSKLGLAYDEVFDITNNQYYCSELIYDAFKFANNDQPIFELQPMTYKDPETNKIFPIWADYFQKLNVSVPEGEPGLNPGGMSKSDYIDIVHFYGKPEGYEGKAALSNL